MNGMGIIGLARFVSRWVRYCSWDLLFPLVGGCSVSRHRLGESICMGGIRRDPFWKQRSKAGESRIAPCTRTRTRFATVKNTRIERRWSESAIGSRRARERVSKRARAGKICKGIGRAVEKRRGEKRRESGKEMSGSDRERGRASGKESEKKEEQKG